MNKLFWILIVCVIIYGVGCLPVPHSRLYKPISELESNAFKKANREIYPNDVRNDFSSHDSSRIVWTGIILNAEQKKTDSTIEVKFEIEHHFYDWIEDFSIQQERIFLSPRGEGLFEFTWYIDPKTDSSEISESIGDMMIVYGIPAAINDSIIELRAYHIRIIDEQWFSTNYFEYGRPGDSMKVLNIPTATSNEDQ